LTVQVRESQAVDTFENELDKRILLAEIDWDDYLADMPGVHEGTPTSFPCYIFTAFLNKTYVHEFVGIDDLKVLERFIMLNGVERRH